MKTLNVVIGDTSGARNRIMPNREDDGPSFSVEPQIIIPPGVYQMAFVGSRTALLYQKAPKLALRFRIVDQGPHFGLELDRWYNVKRLIGVPGKSGKFQIGRNSDFLREYLTLFPSEYTRLDRMNFKPFRSTLIKALVDTVTQNREQKKLPQPLQYSIIRELIEAGV